jgi:hypothetical protein
MESLMPSDTKEITYQPSTLETIDTGIYEWVDKVLDLHTKTNKGIYKVPVLWLGSERVFQVKNDQRIRDKVGKLILPLTTINRTTVTKDPAFKGAIQANLVETNDYRGGAIGAAKRINQEKTSNFQSTIQNKITKGNQQTGKNPENSEIVYDTFEIPVPVYVAITYSVTLRTEYQQQMNDLMSPFITKTDQINSFVFTQDGHKYEGFIQQDYSMNNNTTNIGEEERMFETKIDIKVQGYLMGEGYNRDKPNFSRRENRAKLRFTGERVMVGDKIPWKTKDNDYKE